MHFSLSRATSCAAEHSNVSRLNTARRYTRAHRARVAVTVAAVESFGLVVVIEDRMNVARPD